MLSPIQNNPVSTGFSGTVAVHEVLRKTYFLLSLTLLFSALTAVISMKVSISINPIILFVVWFALLFVIRGLRNHTAWCIAAVFAFTGVGGLLVGPMLNTYINGFTNGSELVFTSLGATGAIFLSLSAYVITTKKDFTFMGGLLFILLITGVLLSLAAMFFNIPMLQISMAALFVVIFSGFILYDTSTIIHNGQTNYVMATVSLYLDILNLFISLLQILAFFAGNRK